MCDISLFKLCITVSTYGVYTCDSPVTYSGVQRDFTNEYFHKRINSSGLSHVQRSGLGDKIIFNFLFSSL